MNYFKVSTQLVETIRNGSTVLVLTKRAKSLVKCSMIVKLKCQVNHSFKKKAYYV